MRRTQGFTASINELEFNGHRPYRMSRDDVLTVEYTGSGEKGRVWLVGADGSRSREWFRPKDLNVFLDRLRMLGWPLSERPKRSQWWRLGSASRMAPNPPSAAPSDPST